MAEALDIATPSAEDLIARAKSLGGGQYVPPPAEAQQMAEDLKAIQARQTPTPETQPQRLDFLAAKPNAAATGGPEAQPQRLDFLKSPPPSSAPPGKVVSADPVNPANVIVTDIKTGGREIVNKLNWLQRNKQQFLGSEKGPLPDVNYTGGTDWFDKVALDQADTDAEKRLYLEQKYGKTNVFQDPRGIFYVQTGKKKVAPGGGSFGSRFSAEAAAQGPEFLAATIGAIAGGATGGIPGAIVGSMLGTGFAKSATESQKILLGRSAKTPAQTRNEIAKEMLRLGGGEAVGQGIGRFIGRATAGNIPRWISGATPQTERLTAITTARGATPPVKAALPHMRVTQWHQALGEKLTGSMLEERNLSYIEQEMTTLLRNSGFTDAEIGPAREAILNPTAALSTKELGESLGSSMQGYAAGLGEAAQAAQESAQQTLDRQLAQIRVMTRERKQAGPLAQDTAEKFYEARKDFSRSMQRVYAQIDKLVGDKPVVPTFLARRQAKSLLEKLPESDIKKVVKEIADLKPHETFENMQRLRSRLAEMGEPADLAASGVLKRDIRNLRTAVDRSFEQAYLETQAGKIVIPEAQQAARILRAADKAYSDGIRKFEDGILNQFLDSTKSGMMPDPSSVARLLLQRGNVERIAEFKRILGKDAWDRVVAQDWRDMLETTTEKSGEIDAGIFFREVMKRQRSGVLEAAYGTKTAAEIVNFARRQAVLGNVPKVVLDKGDKFADAVFAASTAQKRLEDFVNEHYLAELAQPTIEPELVYRTLVQPGHETQLERIFEHFGRDSKQVADIRKAAMQTLLKDAIINMETGAGRTVGPDALRNALKRMTPRQQELLFPDGLADDLNLVADEAQFLFPQIGEDMSAGLAAGAIKASLPFGIVKRKLALMAYAWGTGWSWILSRPSVVRWLALGIRSRDTATRQTTDETFRALIRAGALGMLPGQAPVD